MMKMNKFYFTKIGLSNHRIHIQNLENRLKGIQARQGEICGGETDTWHDNAAYDQLVIELRGADKLLSDAYVLLNQVEIVSYPTNVESIVLGTKVLLEINGKEKEYSIVGYGESDIKQNKILYEAPLALALLGKEEGDTYIVKINGKEKEIEILEINPLDE